GVLVWTPDGRLPPLAERADPLRLDRRARDAGRPDGRPCGPGPAGRFRVRSGRRPVRGRAPRGPWPLEAGAVPLPYRPPSGTPDGDSLLRRVQLRALGNAARWDRTRRLGAAREAGSRGRWTPSDRDRTDGEPRSA